MPVRILAPPRPTKANPAIVALRDYSATISTNVGDITIRFFPDAAPNTVRTFIKLAQRGRYDGKRFYCVFQERMILAGDPPGAAKSEGGPRIPHERSAMPHRAKTLAMDRTPGGPSLATRFFINLEKQEHLDRDYTVFGAITKGLDVARAIGSVPTKLSDGSPEPIEEIVIEQVIVTKTKKKEAETSQESKE